MAAPRVFISYSHDSAAHRRRVLALSQRLRGDGVETILDRHVNGTPEQGWPRWMLDQLDGAQFVLAVCTPAYYRRFRGHESPGAGHGADWEGALITQELYDRRSRTLKFVPVLVAPPADAGCVPEPLRAFTVYRVHDRAEYRRLVDFLHGRAAIVPRPVATAAAGRAGAPPRAPEPPGADSPQHSLVEHLRWRFVGRRAVLRDIEAVLQDPQAPRHCIVEAPAGFGKSALMATLVGRHPAFVHHFVRADDQHHTATALLQGLCHQLAARIPGGEGGPHASADLAVLEREFERLKRLALRSLAPGATLVLLIDGLDESAAGPETVLRPAYLRAADPRLRVVLSFRTGSLDPGVDLEIGRAARFVLPPFDADDACELFAALGRADLAARRELLDEMVALTQGEPFYLRFLAEDLAEQREVASLPRDLPADARDYIRRQVRGLDGAALARHLPPALHDPSGTALAVASLVLRVLAVAKDWLTRAQLVEIVGAERRALVKAVLPALRRYVVSDDSGAAEDPAAQRYLVMPLRLREGIARAFDADEIREARQRIATYGLDWRRHRSGFAFRYLAEVLVELDDYDALVATLQQPFLQAKAQALRAPHAVMADLLGGLRLALKRSDEPRVIRFLASAARVRHAIAQRARHGGIAVDAAAGAFDIAADAARALGDPALAARQLLAIAEAALAAGREGLGLALVDEAIALPQSRLDEARADVEALVRRLVVEQAATERARALARAARFDADPLLAEAAKALAGRDPARALDTVAAIAEGWRADEAAVALMRRVVATHPEAARAAWKGVLHRAGGHVEARWLGAIGVFRCLDGDALVDARLRALFDDARRRVAADARDRGAVEWCNRLAVAFGELDPPAALAMALASCPEIVDSRHTRTTTLAQLLLQAARRGHAVDPATLQRILAEPRRRETMGRPSFADELLGALAVQFALAGRRDRADEQLATMLDDDGRHASAALIALSADPLAAGAVGETLGRCRWPADGARFVGDAVIAVLLDRFETDAGHAAAIVAAVTPAAARVALLGRMLAAAGGAALGTLASCAASSVRAIEGAAERAEARIALADAMPPEDTAAIGAVLDGIEGELPALAATPDGTAALVRAVALAAAVGRRELAAHAARRAAAAAAEAGEEGHTLLQALARHAIDGGIDLDRGSFEACMAACDDPLTSARLAARSRWAEAHLRRRMADAALDLSPLRTTLAAFAPDEAQGAAADAGLKTAAQRSLVSTAHGMSHLYDDPAAAREHLLAAWRIVHTEAQAHAPARDADDLYDREDRQILVALAQVDLDAAIEHARELPPWTRHVVLLDIVQARRGDAAIRARALAEAAAAAREVEPFARRRALVNVAGTAVAFGDPVPGGVADEAIAAIASLDAADRVRAHLDALAAGLGTWPATYRETFWERLTDDLAQVEWHGTDTRRIFEAAARLRDDGPATKVWCAIARQWQQREPLTLYFERARLARIAFELARRQAADAARPILEWLRPAARPDDDWEPAVQAWRVCTLQQLGDADAMAAAQQLLADLEQGGRNGARWRDGIDGAIEVLANHHRELLQDEALRGRLLAIAQALPDADDRGRALHGLVEALLRERLLKSAAGVLARVPHGRWWHEAVGAVLDSLGEGDTPPAVRDAAWPLVFDVVRDDAHALLDCADLRLVALLGRVAPAQHAGLRADLEREIAVVEQIVM